MSLNLTNLNTLAAIHYYTPNDSLEHFNPKQCLRDAMDEIKHSRLAIAEAAKTIEGMETRSKRLQEQLDHALEMLNGKQATTATIAAQSQGRGLDAAEPKEA